MTKQEFETRIKTTVNHEGKFEQITHKPSRAAKPGRRRNNL